MVFRKERLVEPVVAATHFEQQFRREQVRERAREQLHVRRRIGVVAGQEPAAEQAQREALVAVAEEVADRQQIDRADVLIELRDEAVHAIVEERRRLQVVAVLIRRLVGRRPGVPIEDALDHGIDDAAVCRDR